MAPRSSARRRSGNASKMDVDDPPPPASLADVVLPPLPYGELLDAAQLPPLPNLSDATSSSPMAPPASSGGYNRAATMFAGPLPTRHSARKANNIAASGNAEASTSSRPSTSAQPARQYSQHEVATWRNAQVAQKQAEVRFVLPNSPIVAHIILYVGPAAR